MEGRLSAKLSLGLGLADELRASGAEDRLCAIVRSIAASCAEISDVLRGGSCTGGGTRTVGSHNAFGDSQLEVDLRTHDVVMNHLSSSGAVATASSEEDPTELPVPHDENGALYSVAFDPLDGSSIVDCNWAVGTIFGIWGGTHLVGTSGRDIVCAACAVYGPRTTLYIALPKRSHVVELTLLAVGDSDSIISERYLNASWSVTRRTSAIGPGKLFAPANLRATQDNSGYRELMQFYMTFCYQLRYTGGMVPDVCQLFVKGKGVFVSPVSDAAPAKLRVLYEALPMAFLTEAAGGRSSDGLRSLLDRVVDTCEDRTAVCLGNAEEVERFEKFCASK